MRNLILKSLMVLGLVIIAGAEGGAVTGMLSTGGLVIRMGAGLALLVGAWGLMSYLNYIDEVRELKREEAWQARKLLKTR